MVAQALLVLMLQAAQTVGTAGQEQRPQSLGHRLRTQVVAVAGLEILLEQEALEVADAVEMDQVLFRLPEQPILAAVAVVLMAGQKTAQAALEL